MTKMNGTKTLPSPETPPPAISCFDTHGQFAWDSTSLSLFTTCPRKYYYRMIEGWVPRRKSVHLLFGGWYASALERFAKLLAKGMDRDRALEDTIHEVLRATWEPGYASPADAATHTNPDWTKGRPWQSADNNKTRENLIRTIIWYVDHFKDENCTTVILSDGTPAVELSFKIDIGNNLLWCGHLDRLVDLGGDYFIMDQKTTGNTITARFWDQWHTDSQMSGYTFAGKIIYNMPVKGVIIDAAQIMVGGTRYERGFTHRTDDQLNEWLNDAKHYISLARTYFQEKFWPMNRSSCGNYGGCEYRTVCGHSPQVRANFLKGDFTQDESRWNPLQSR